MTGRRNRDHLHPINHETAATLSSWISRVPRTLADVLLIVWPYAAGSPAYEVWKRMPMDAGNEENGWWISPRQYKRPPSRGSTRRSRLRAGSRWRVLAVRQLESAWGTPAPVWVRYWSSLFT